MAQYIVQPGDYPTKIAKRFGISFEEFKAWNPGLCVGNNCQVLHPGQVLQVPGPQPGYQPQPQPQPQYRPQPQPQYQPQPVAGTPPWMRLAMQELQLGVAESARGDNPRIVAYLRSVGINGHDETAWCGAFVNWCLVNAGVRSAGTGLAAGWLNFGRAVVPTYGAITVLKPTEAGNSGHVGFLHAQDANNVWLISGNSSNRIRLSAYPRHRLYNSTPFRWPG
jgi:uncharacterized protein (TIGR02594 family)